MPGGMLQGRHARTAEKEKWIQIGVHGLKEKLLSMPGSRRADTRKVSAGGTVDLCSDLASRHVKICAYKENLSK